MASALMELMKPEVDKKVKEERNMMAQIVSALMAGKDNDTIIKELNCTLDQITPMRAAMEKNKNYLIVFPKVGIQCLGDL